MLVHIRPSLTQKTPTARHSRNLRRYKNKGTLIIAKIDSMFYQLEMDTPEYTLEEVETMQEALLKLSQLVIDLNRRVASLELRQQQSDWARGDWANPPNQGGTPTLSKPGFAGLGDY